jgi:hypothetical protein
MTPRPLRHFGKAFPVSAVFGLICVACAGQTASFATSPTRYLVCDHGEGSFRGNLPRNSPAHDLTVSVSSTRQNNGFATHTCLAELTWNGDNLNVTRDAAQADIDVMGADLGLGSLVVAFQVKATDADPTIQYKIYSLSAPPQLLRTITGQDYFSAADTRLDGTVEIWTTDAVAVNGFEDLPRSAFDAAAVILRFQNEKLFDVSSEFRPYYDHQIELLRSQLDPQQLSAFEKSDGKLSNETLPAQGRPRGLLATKIKVLEIVWAYLYSDREQDAWQVVSTLWPQSDQSRIIAAIRAAQARGMRTQVDGVSHQPPPPAPKHAAIYTHTPVPGLALPEELRKTVADSIPQRIVLMTSPTHNPANWAAERDIELVTDEAGKVRSAKMKKRDSEDETNKGWLDAAAGWKYIPAFRDGQPSAFRWKLHVQRDQ